MTRSAAPHEPLFCPYHILTSSVICYWAGARQHRTFLWNTPQMTSIVVETKNWNTGRNRVCHRLKIRIIKTLPCKKSKLVLQFVGRWSRLHIHLQVGLAVGDIDAIRRNAAFKRMAMQVMYIAKVENSFPRCISRRFRHPEVTLQPNRRTLRKRYAVSTILIKSHSLISKCQKNSKKQLYNDSVNVYFSLISLPYIIQSTVNEKTEQLEIIILI